MESSLMKSKKIDIDTEAIRESIERVTKSGDYSKDNIGLFTIKTANQWIEKSKTQPIPRMLFSEFWFESELCILFADTNLGKSILAVQIADSISRGLPINGFKNESIAQKVLYFDFEMGKKQFENRYSANYTNHYVWNDNFSRVEIDPDSEIPDVSFETYLYQSLEKAIYQTDTKVLIIDNITYLKTETERAKDALPLMKQLQSLKKQYSLSILALAHTPKRDLSKPITKNDLQGSKMLINFCDSSFAIGESSNDKNIRYLKQIKQRNTECIYDSENICTCLISKESNFLCFEFLNFGSETNHLRQITDKDKSGQLDKAREMKNDGKSLREIGKELGISHTMVAKILSKV